MNDFLNELKEYIKEHYTGTEAFEPISKFVPKVCECCAAVSYDEDDEELALVPPKESPRPICFGMSSQKMRKKESLDDLLKKTEDTFSDRLMTLIIEKHVDEVELYKKANLDRRLFSKLRNRSYKPGKNTILALIVALKLNLQEARELLSFAGYNLAPNDKTDIIVSFFLEKQIYDIYTVNETLDRYGEKCLGNAIK